MIHFKCAQRRYTPEINFHLVNLEFESVTTFTTAPMGKSDFGLFACLCIENVSMVLISHHWLKSKVCNWKI